MTHGVFGLVKTR